MKKTSFAGAALIKGNNTSVMSYALISAPTIIPAIGSASLFMARYLEDNFQ